MRKLAALSFVSLDGVMQAVRLPDEDTSGGFLLGGWAEPYWQPVMAQVGQEAMGEPYDMVLGRKTYELFSSHQKSSPNPGSVYVVSSDLADPTWKNVNILSGDIVSEITRLKGKDGPLLQIHGSWQLIQTLHAAGLIDEYRLWIFPIILGSGKRLFESRTPPCVLHLSRTAPTGNGVVMSIYQYGGLANKKDN